MPHIDRERPRLAGTIGRPFRASASAHRDGRPWSAVLVVLSTAAAIAVTLAEAVTPVRAPVTILFIVLSPGLAIIRLARLGFAPQLVLSIALSIALAGIVATAQLYAGAWSPRSTLTMLATVAIVATSLDPWLVVPRWHSSQLGAIERRVVPLLLVIAAGVVAAAVVGVELRVGEWRASTLAAAAAGLAGTVALAIFVVRRSVAALYAAAILLPATLPGIATDADSAGFVTTITALGYAVAWTFVAWIRSARGGGLDWQLLVGGGFLAASGAAAVVPDLTLRYLPGSLLGLALALVVLQSDRVTARSGVVEDPSALVDPTPGPSAEGTARVDATAGQMSPPAEALSRPTDFGRNNRPPSGNLPPAEPRSRRGRRRLPPAAPLNAGDQRDTPVGERPEVDSPGGVPDEVAAKARRRRGAGTRGGRGRAR